MVLDLDTMSVNSKPGSHIQITYQENDYWVKELTLYKNTVSDYGFDSDNFSFDENEYRNLYEQVSWLPELYEYKIDGLKRIWKYATVKNIINRKKLTYDDNIKYFGKYFLGEVVPFMFNYKRQMNKIFFHSDPSMNFVLTKDGFCLLEPNDWQWVEEDKVNKIMRYAFHKLMK